MHAVRGMSQLEDSGEQGESRNFYVDLSIADLIKLRFPVKIGGQLGYVWFSILNDKKLAAS